MKIDKNIPIPEPNYKYSSYKWKCINTMLKMKVGDSIRINNRTLASVKNTLCLPSVILSPLIFHIVSTLYQQR